MSSDSPPARGVRSRAALIAGLLVVWTFGFLVGLFIGLRHGFETLPHASRTPAPATAAPSLIASATAAPAPPTAPAEFVGVDLGADDGAEQLRGDWSAAESFDEGRVLAAVTRAASASLLLPPPPGSGRWQLWAVAKAVGGAEDEPLSVALSTTGGSLGSWSIGAEWSLLSTPWPAAVGPDGGASEPGQAALLLTLRQPSSAGDEARPPMGLALDYVELAKPAAAARVDLGTARGRSRLLSGFWAVEAADDSSRFVWTRGKRSTIALAIDPAATDYRLVLRAGAIEFIAPVRVSVRLNDREIGAIDVAADDAEHPLAVERAAVRSGANLVELRYARTARPVDHGGDDTRELALAISGLALEPAPE